MKEHDEQLMSRYMELAELIGVLAQRQQVILKEIEKNDFERNKALKESLEIISKPYKKRRF